MSNESIAKPSASMLSVMVGRFGTTLMVTATLALAFVITIEMINILFYDNWGDEYFLFRTAGVLSDVEIGPLTYLMFGSLLVALIRVCSYSCFMMYILHTCSVQRHAPQENVAPGMPLARYRQP